MKIGFLLAPYADIPLSDLLAMLRGKYPALDCVEIGVSLYGAAHCDPPLYARDRTRRAEFEDIITGHGYSLSSLSAHGNPLHPDPEIAETSMARIREAVALAARLDACLCRDREGNPVRVVNCFSGLPAADVRPAAGAHAAGVEAAGSRANESAGGARQAGSVPGWHVCPWPDEHYDAFQRQMAFAGTVWKKLAAEARDAGVALAFEMHPNFLVHNPETYLRLLELAGDDGSVLGLNFDPSHLFWRNMDPVAVVRYLNRTLGSGPIKHCHGKDTYVDRYNTAVNGNHSALPYTREGDRVWRFVTIGEGWDPVNGAHDLNWWARFVTELQLGGYDHVMSIEHEDSRKSFAEGLGKALGVLDRAVNREAPGPVTWAGR